MFRQITTSLILMFFLFSFPNLFQAQNLVPNPGFEEWDGTNQSGTMEHIDHWYAANGTTDYHHTSNDPSNNLTSLTPCPGGQGDTGCGYPYEGQAVLGAWKANGPDGSKEWSGVQLLEPMEAGACYEISFWIQNKKDNPVQLYETNQWGMFFSKTKFPFFNPNLADFSPMADQWVACEEVIGGSEWQQVTFDYTASDDFEYAYLGYMGNVSTSTYVAENDDYLLGFYVWFDMVVIERIEPQLTLSPDVTICQEESVIIEATSNFPVIWNGGESSETEIQVQPEHTTIYYVETQDSTACSIRDSIVITVVGDEEIDFTDGSICEGSEPFVLSSGTTGNWSGLGIVDAFTGTFDPTISGLGAFTIIYNSTADCSENFTMNLEVKAQPPLDFDVDISEGCPPLEVHFTDLSPIQGNNYQWKFGTGEVSNDPISTVHTYTGSGFYDVNLKVDFSDHCSATQTIEGMIEVYDPPIADFTFTPQDPSNINPEVQFIDNSTDDVNLWSWDFGDQTAGDKNEPIHNYLSPGNYDVSLEVTSIHGCSDSISKSLTVNSLINFYIPNAFSPNNDGINDLFEISPWGPLEDFNIIVFNRWGGTIFESDQLDNTWDGKLPNGEIADIGVYIYMIEYKYSGILPGESYKGLLSGDILLVK